MLTGTEETGKGYNEYTYEYNDYDPNAEDSNVGEKTYPDLTTEIVFWGFITTPEAMGNITYGYLGMVAGFSEEILLAGGDFAASNGGLSLTGLYRGIVGIANKADTTEDKENIILGINLYNNSRYDYTLVKDVLRVKLNKKLLIGLLSVFIIFLMVFVVRFNMSDDIASYDEIVSYVRNNYELLEKFPYSAIEEIKVSNEDAEIKQKQEENAIKRYLGKNTIVKNVYAYDENIIQFNCGRSGLLDAGTYTGFYFSKEDIPYRFEFNNLELVEVAPGVFEGQDENGIQQIHGGHKIHTEKIREQWYYYIQYWY